MNEEIKKKLERLEELEKIERAKERWKPYNDMEEEIGQMYRHKDELETAAIYQGEAEQISNEYDLFLDTAGSACMWDAHSELEKQIEAKEKEFEELHQRLTEEEE
tara:strand:+ start:1956 stop:2270 length:315 start_codon:yes stop_codon:yes gene_type:complete